MSWPQVGNIGCRLEGWAPGRGEQDGTGLLTGVPTPRDTLLLSPRAPVQSI